MKTILRTVREKSGESLNGMAIRAGIEPALLSLVERGKRPSRRTAERIAKALAVDPKTLWADFEELRKW